MKRIQVIFFGLMLSTALFADISVKGTVIDADNSEPMIGVSILVKGTTTGTITDFDGNFELSVPDKATLQLSYMGYKTIEVRAVPMMNIIMETDAQQLQEVVSLGYSAVKKAELSSAVVTVDAEKLTDVTSPDVGNMLQGKVAGVQVTNAGGQPGDAAQIRIRGTGSITASAAPIYVVDGVMGGSFNPNDVETISVLKDAGSTGIYGAAAAGGVIVVTTKSGKKGDKVSVDLRAKVGGKQALFGNFKMMNGEEMYQFQRSLMRAGTFDLLYKKVWNEYLQYQDWDWKKEFFHTGLIQNYNVAVKGGSEHLGYYVSLDYFGEQGTLQGTGMKKISGHASLKADICKWLDMNVKMDFTKSYTDYAPSWMMLNDAFYKSPWDNPYTYDENGNLTSDYIYIEPTMKKRPDNGRLWYSHERWNSLHTAQYNYSRSTGFGYSGVLQLNFHFTDWLHFSSTNTFSSGYSKSSEYTDRRTYHDTYRQGHLGESIGLDKSFGTTNILKGGNQWGAHSFNAMAGFEYSVWKSEYTSSAGTGMPNGIDALNASAPYSVGGYNIPGAGWSVFLQASYDYAKRYFITATYRAEASSIFAPSHRVGHFPSVAASWLISNENFMKDQQVVSFLKLRASYGITGNNNIPPYQYLSTYSLTNRYQNTVGATSSRLASPDLRWETAYMAALGIDLTFIKRIDMSIDLYQTDNTDLLLDVPVAPSTGFFKIMKNAGSVRNRGIEFRIDANIIDMKKWRWDLGFNIGFNQNRVTHTPDHVPFLQTAINVSQQIKEGEDIYSWYMKEWAGVDPANGNPLWYMVDDKGNYVLDNQGDKTTTSDYNATHARIVGTASPMFSGGINTELSWNGIFLHVNTNFTYGNKIYNQTREMTDADGAYTDINQLSLAAYGWTRWTKAGDIATHPKAVAANESNSNAVSSRYLEDGSFFRLRNITIGYDFPTKLISKAKMTKCRIYFTADNIATATSFSGMDPEINLVSGNNTLAGLYSSNYPVGRSFQGGIEISF